VPGLHMNNIAAMMTAYSATAITAFGLLGQMVGTADAAVLLVSFISAALVGHQFAEAVTSTYIGIPAGDIVSVLPAHRLARAGMGDAAVSASADGSLSGVLLAGALLLPMCVLMGSPAGVYHFLAKLMGFIMLFFSAVLLYTEGSGRRGVCKMIPIGRASLVFLAAGALGTVVFCTDFYACRIPDLPFRDGGFVLRSALLLPMFAGLYGVPGLILGLRSSMVMDCSKRPEGRIVHRASRKDLLLSFLGGSLVGWMPGMTAGSSATICAPSVREFSAHTDVQSSLRFIWIYSSISAAGSVFAVGALFMILRARSGCMDAAQFFLGERLEPGSITGNLSLMMTMLLAMLIAAWLGHWLISRLNPRLHRIRSVICSRRVAVASLVFVSSLSLLLTGTRGALVVATATCLGLLPPLAGIRRIQLMGCLLVPVTMEFFGIL
jgi:TctA family transporter